MLKSRATWAPGTAQPEPRGSLQPRKSAKARLHHTPLCCILFKKCLRHYSGLSRGDGFWKYPYVRLSGSYYGGRTGYPDRPRCICMQAAANLYIPKFAEADAGDRLGNGKASVMSGPEPARPSNEPLSPFETIPLEDSNEKPVEGSEKAVETKKVLPSFGIYRMVPVSGHLSNPGAEFTPVTGHCAWCHVSERLHCVTAQPTTSKSLGLKHVQGSQYWG